MKKIIIGLQVFVSFEQIFESDDHVFGFSRSESVRSPKSGRFVKLCCVFSTTITSCQSSTESLWQSIAELNKSGWIFLRNVNEDRRYEKDYFRSLQLLRKDCWCIFLCIADLTKRPARASLSIFLNHSPKVEGDSFSSTHWWGSLFFVT